MLQHVAGRGAWWGGYRYDAMFQCSGEPTKSAPGLYFQEARQADSHAHRVAHIWVNAVHRLSPEEVALLKILCASVARGSGAISSTRAA